MENQDLILRESVEATDTGMVRRNTEELNAQFGEFLRTKGIQAKFSLALENMRESAARQHAVDKANFEAVKAKSAEENADFVEFLHTKGVPAKARLVVENIRRGAAEAKHSRRMDAAEPADAAALPAEGESADPINAENLTEAFQAFLKEKGLDGQYAVEVTENK